jgi:hypothetical protein
MMTRGRLRKLGLAAGVVIGVGIVVVWVLSPDDTAGPCNVIDGVKMLPEIPEASGLAVGHRNPGIIWSHNDSGSEAMLFALDSSGTVRSHVRVPIPMRDWEDISAARCPSGDCLYLADIGDNKFYRKQIQIYRVPEPALDDLEAAEPEIFTLTYEDGPHNAEAAFVVSGDFFVITRDRIGAIYRSTVPALGKTEITLERIAYLDLEAVTDAEASPDEKTVVVRTPHEAAFYRTADLVSGQTIPYLRSPLDGLREPQGEGVAFDANGMLYLASGGRLWNRAGRLLALQCGRLTPM